MSYTVKVRGRWFERIHTGVILHWLETDTLGQARLALKKDDGSMISLGDIAHRDYEICADYQRHKELNDGLPNTGDTEGSN